MTDLSHTHALVRRIARDAPTSLSRHRALLLDQQLNGMSAPLTPGMLRQIVIAVRGLVGHAWLSAHTDEDAIIGFVRLDLMTAPPPMLLLDHALANCLEARYRPEHSMRAPDFVA